MHNAVTEKKMLCLTHNLFQTEVYAQKELVLINILQYVKKSRLSNCYAYLQYQSVEQ